MNKIMSYFFVLCYSAHLGAYTIKNNTNYPTQVALTTIYQTIDNKYHQGTITLDFAPHESKDVSVGWMKSMQATINENGTKKTTPVVSGGLVEGNSSGLPPSWIISPAQQDQYGQSAYMIQAAL